MSYHEWGDDWPYWDDLYAAQTFIYEYVHKRSLCRILMKEKYGSIRYSFVFPPGVSVRQGFVIELPWPQKTVKIGSETFKRPYILFSWSGNYIVRLWERYATWLLRKAVFKAVEKWPQCEDEILSDLDEDIVGEEIHGRYWTHCE